MSMTAHYLNVMLLSVAESSGTIFIPIGRNFIKDLIIKLMVVAIWLTWDKPSVMNQVGPLAQCK